jgi:hypothetical protein
MSPIISRKSSAKSQINKQEIGDQDARNSINKLQPKNEFEEFESVSYINQET